MLLWQETSRHEIWCTSEETTRFDSGVKVEYEQDETDDLEPTQTAAEEQKWKYI